MPRNEYLLATIGVDISEIRPSEVSRRYIHTPAPHGHKYRSDYPGCPSEGRPFLPTSAVGLLEVFMGLTYATVQLIWATLRTNR